MYKSIVVGTDGSSTARGAVDEAARLAKAFDAPLHLVYAVSQSGAAAAAVGVGAPGMAGAGALWDDMARDQAEERLASLAGTLRADGVKVESHVVPGSAVGALLDVAAATTSDLVVVGSKGMTGARRVLGSVPNGVAHRANCSVLIVKTV